MKFKIAYKAILLFSVSILSACDDALDINTDPNNPGSSTPQLTLPAAQVSLATRLETDYNLHGSILANYWTQGPTAAQYSFVEQYNITANAYNGAWASMYAGTLRDLQFVKESALASDLKNYAAIAQILQSYTYQILVDLYDRVPYFDALQGKGGTLSPRFDNGDVIYDDLIVKIDEALSWISLSAPIPGTDDVIFSGNMRLWKKFGNTLKLKIFIRQAFKRPAAAQAGIESLYTNGAEFLTEGENARVGFGGTTGSENPIWQELNLTAFGNIVASKTSIDSLLKVSDSRINNLYDRAINGSQYVGLLQGVGTADGGQFNDYSVPDGAFIFNKTAPVYLMTGYESLFLQAEAVERGWGTGTAKALYDQAVKESFAFWGADGSSTVAPGGDYEYDGDLNTIYYQKWLAFNGEQGFEGWSEWRRTGIPALQKSVQGAPLPNKFPLRLVWPLNETSANPNAPTLVSVDTPVWWDTTF